MKPTIIFLNHFVYWPYQFLLIHHRVMIWHLILIYFYFQILIYILVSSLGSEYWGVKTWYSWNLILLIDPCVIYNKYQTSWPLILRHASFQDIFSNAPKITQSTMKKHHSSKSHDKPTLLNFMFPLIISYSQLELFHLALYSFILCSQKVAFGFPNKVAEIIFRWLGLVHLNCFLVRTVSNRLTCNRCIKNVTFGELTFWLMVLLRW